MEYGLKNQTAIFSYVATRFSAVDPQQLVALFILVPVISGIFNLQFSDGLTLSWHELNAIVLYLATDIGKLRILLFFIFLCVLLCTIFILNNNYY